MGDTKYTKWIFLFMCVLLVGNMQATRYVCMDRYTANDGLTSDLVHCIDQDTFGHIWIASDYGLSRFDGNSFKRYTINSCPSMLMNEIFHIHSYNDGDLFLGSQSGIVLKYNPKTDCFENYAPEDFKSTYYKQIEGFSQTRSGEKVVATSNGYYMLKKGSTRFTNDFSAFEKGKDCYVLSFYEDSFGRYWISSFNTLVITDKEGNLLQKFDLAKGVSAMFSSKIQPISERQILISCFSDFLYSFQIDDNGHINAPSVIKLPFSNLNGILQDRKGHFWYISDGSGLWYSEDVPQKSTVFEQVKPSNCKAEEIEKLYAIKEAKNGDIWIGTNSAGLCRFNPYASRAIRFSTDIQYPKTMASGFVEDEDHNLYVSCDGGGLTRLSADYSVCKEYDETNGLTSRNVVSLEEDQRGHLWMATWGGGILEFDPSSQQFRQERFEGLNSNLSCFAYVASLSNGEIWACTGGDGLYMRTVEGKWLRYILQFSENEYDMWPSRVVEGKDNCRWISTSRSLWWVKGNERRPLMADFSRSNSTDPNIIYDMIVDKDGYLFASVTHHILRYSPDGLQCDTLKFLPNGEFYSFCINVDGQLCACGSKGLFTIDYATQSFKRLNYNFEEKGLKFFRIHSAYASRNGRIFWGTKNGFVIQNPVHEEQKQSVIHLQLSDAVVSDVEHDYINKYVSVSNGGAIENIKLPYNHSGLSVAVDMVEYTDVDMELYYRLKGFSDKWITVPENRQIQFSYIPSGHYSLELKVMQNDTEVRQIAVPLSVLPPWWKTLWFTLVSLMAIVLVVWLIFRWRVRKLKERQEELQQLVKERTKELDQKNELIEEQNTELKRVLFDKDRVLSVLAHDLKNPMFAIVGALEGWIRREPSMENTEKRKMIENVLSSSQTLQTEMGRLLEWARAKSDKIDFNPSDIDVKSSLNNVSSLLSSLLVKKKIQLTIDCQVSHCAWVDSRMLSTIFRNFINNAIKFTPENGHIFVSACEEGKTVKIKIVDNGVGMSEETKHALLAQGYCDSTLGTDNEKGSGLGFRICKDYIARMNGAFQLESVEGQGTTITLSFPLSEKLVSLVTPSAQDSELKRLESTVDKDILEGNTVIVVDDDPLICQNVSDILRQYMEVYTASNGTEALKLIAEHEIDLVLSDVEMPVMNGIELSRQLSSEEATSAIPFLFLSAKNEQSDRLLGLLSGAIDYIPKPFSTSELLMKVNNIMRIRQKQQKRLLQQNYYHQVAPAPSVVENEKEAEKLNPFVTKFMNTIENNYTNSEFSIELLAEEMGMSQSTLSRRTKTLLGKTPVEVMNEFRLNKAFQLLKDIDNESNIAGVAYEVGFSDPAYFTRKFKDFFGILPSSVK